MLVILLFFRILYVLLYLVDNVDEEYEYFSNNKSSASGYCLACCQFQLGVAYKSAG